MSETEAGRRLPELEVVARGMIFSAEDAPAEEAVAYFTALFHWHQGLGSLDGN